MRRHERYWFWNWFNASWQSLPGWPRWRWPDVVLATQAAGLIGEGVVHREAGGQHDRGQDGERDQGVEGLLAVLAPGEPDHAFTSHAVRVLRVSALAR